MALLIDELRKIGYPNQHILQGVFPQPAEVAPKRLSSDETRAAVWFGPLSPAAPNRRLLGPRSPIG